MKLFCAQSDLSTNLSLVSRAVPSRPTHPVLANVLLVADEATQRVSVTAFDLSLGIRTSFAAHVENGGAITLPAKLFNDIVSRLPDGELELNDEGNASIGESDEGAIATLTCASGRYQVRGMGASEFPELPVIEDGEMVYLPVEGLLAGLQGSLFATSADETKQVLTGVHVTLQQDSLEFAATDGHRLAVVQTTSQPADTTDTTTAIAEGTSLDVTIPAKTLRELERMVGAKAASGSVALQLSPNQVVFELADQRLVSRLLEGQYPNYRQLIPRQFARQMTLERRLFLGALERIAVLADQKNSVVKLSLDAEQQELALSVDAQDVGSGREVVPAQISGETVDVAFNVKYLMDGLKALNTSEVQMQLNTPTSPAVLSPLGSVKMTYLVMPVQIRS